MSIAAAREFMRSLSQDASMQDALTAELAGAADPVAAVSAFAGTRGFDVQPADLRREPAPAGEELSDAELDAVNGGVLSGSYSSRGIIIINGYDASSKGIIIING